jgi:hypothetical protein
VLVVVPLVLGEDVSGVCLVEDEHVVADFVAEGSDDAALAENVIVLVKRRSGIRRGCLSWSKTRLPVLAWTFMRRVGTR